MTVNEYITKNDELMANWEKACREWLREKKKEDKRIIPDATFYKDGVFDPVVWFSENNQCRPLFILKEVHEKPLREKRLFVNFLGSYKGINDRDFCQEKADYDLWDGERTWRRLAMLAQGLLQVQESNEYPNYELFDKPQFDIDNIPIEDESLSKYRSVLGRIAVINLKKMPGGSSDNSQESKRTICYPEHVKRYSDKLKYQIGLIDPTIIVCCGITSVMQCVNGLGIHGVPIRESYHPASRVSTARYYDDFLLGLKNRR